MSGFRENYGGWYIAYLIFASWLPESRHLYIARKLRNFFGKKIMVACDDTSNIERRAVFGKKASIGKNSSIGVNCEIYGPVEIGNDVMMGPEVLIYTSGHEHSRTDIPMIKQGSFEEKRVIIGDDCWIGRRAIIMPGVEIAKGCIIGAGAVVTKNTQPYGIYGGVPEKRMKER